VTNVHIPNWALHVHEGCGIPIAMLSLTLPRVGFTGLTLLEDARYEDRTFLSDCGLCDFDPRLRMVGSQSWGSSLASFSSLRVYPHKGTQLVKAIPLDLGPHGPAQRPIPGQRVAPDCPQQVGPKSMVRPAMPPREEWSRLRALDLSIGTELVGIPCGKSSEGNTA